MRIQVDLVAKKKPFMIFTWSGKIAQMEVHTEEDIGDKKIREQLEKDMLAEFFGKIIDIKIKAL